MNNFQVSLVSLKLNLQLKTHFTQQDFAADLQMSVVPFNMISLTVYTLGISTKKKNNKTIKVLKIVEKLPAKPYFSPMVHALEKRLGIVFFN